MSPRTYEHPPAGRLSMSSVLAALSDPVRLEMVQRLSDGEEHDSLSLADDLPRSTLTYHTRMLREAGVTWTRGVGRGCFISLRTEDLEKAFPGLLPSVLHHLRDAPESSE